MLKVLRKGKTKGKKSEKEIERDKGVVGIREREGKKE